MKSLATAAKPRKRALLSWHRFALAALLALPLNVSAIAQTADPTVSCESLAKLALPDTTITTAKIVKTGEFQFPQHPPGSGGYPTNMDEAKTMPPFCMVAATLKPTSDSKINIEVWLPPSGWNGKLMAVGNGGLGGRISHAGMITAILRGYVGTSSDSGHDVVEDNGSGNYLLGHPEKAIDLGYRAEHEMTLKAKAIVAAYYGTGPKHSYFLGNRMGGYQGLTEARRYPEDYDGIVAENPETSFILPDAGQLWAPWLVAQDPSRRIPAAKFAMIHQAVLNACDGLDGAKDGTLENPLNCHFNPDTLLCKAADNPDCLTAPQVDLLKKIYQGPVNPRTGKTIVPGPAPGAEMGEVASSANGEPRAATVDLFKYVVFQNPNWDWKTLNWDSDIDKAVKATAMLATDPDIKGFAGRGGKLLIYSAWGSADNPLQMIDYYNAATKSMGTKEAASSLRLFTIPGQFQDAPFDRIKVLEQWVEQGKAPDQIVASYYKDGNLTRTHLLCAYPEAARYRGTGSTDNAQSFICADANAGNSR